MKFPDLAYINWAKSLPRVEINLARSGIEHCPASLLGLTSSDLVVSLPVRYGYAPLREAIAARYGIASARVFPMSGGTSFANWVACATVLDGLGHGAEVIVERPTYEPLIRIPQALGHRIRRLDRRFEDDYAIDLDRFASLVTTKTRLAIVTNLHNPSGARIPMSTLRAMSSMLARVKAYLLVDEVYLECVFGSRPESSVLAGPNVLVTALIGWKVAGSAGGLVALGAFCGPAAALSYSVGGLWDRMRDAPWRKAFQRAILPISVGFILSGGYVVATPHGMDWKNALIAGASAAALYATRLNPLWILAAGGALGFLLF